LIQSLIRKTLISAVIIGAFAGIYFFTDSLLEQSVKEKTAAEQVLSQNQSQANSLADQLQKSNVAEKRFLETQSTRTNFDFSANNAGLKEWLRSAIMHYRFSNNFKLSLTAEKPAEAKDLSTKTHQAVEHRDMRIELNAISDAHVFSFLDDMSHSAPGFIVLENISLKRTGDIDKSTITSIRAGSAPQIVEAKIVFNWIGLNEKTAPLAPTTAEAK
jgi:hypothetical protein